MYELYLNKRCYKRTSDYWEALENYLDLFSKAKQGSLFKLKFEGIEHNLLEIKKDPKTTIKLNNFHKAIKNKDDLGLTIAIRVLAKG